MNRLPVNLFYSHMVGKREPKETKTQFSCLDDAFCLSPHWYWRFSFRCAPNEKANKLRRRRFHWPENEEICLWNEVTVLLQMPIIFRWGESDSIMQISSHTINPICFCWRGFSVFFVAFSSGREWSIILMMKPHFRKLITITLKWVIQWRCATVYAW